MDSRRIIWVASFPKSGNTWVRIFLEHYLHAPDGKLDINTLGHFVASDISQDMFNRITEGTFRAETTQEWVAARPQALRALLALKPGFHFVKTHCDMRKCLGQPLIPPELTAGAIYILRNPFDVAHSYARHIAGTPDEAIGRMTDPGAALAAQAEERDNGIRQIVGRWDDHVRRWTGAPGLTRHVMRYEDMVADRTGAFRSLLEFLKVPVHFGKLRRVLRNTEFGALRKQEGALGFRERPPGMERFFARGRPGGWREELTPAQVARLRREFLPTLEAWYPEMLEETEAFAGAEA